ncbi:TetR/AcrR family transcriptional regulator [Leucobacter luti]|uniref:TetR/AcrR family transcriptional regulator n=1 Tax=Leucobacter luti TaxID=340320 RepID=UPI001C68C44B|nr:TetR/AcrR family transcriptional regulator [Leucobacter luti]QYM75931.1 TetR/AcrR family transcriptional regulator [Leucobacter luti]
MSDSAEFTGRAAKMRRTRIAITEHARKLTAAHGINGFTIEDVCEPVGISRRTFFNYFPSKEAAVVGTPPDLLESEAIRNFVAGGARTGRISATLLDDLVETAAEMMDEVFAIAGTITHVNAIVAREPSFMEKFVSESEEVHRRFTAMIEEREGLESGDPRARLAIEVLGALLHSSAHTFFATSSTGSIGPVLRNALALSREVLTGTPQSVPPASPPEAPSSALPRT